MPLVVIDKLIKYYGSELILDAVSLTIHERDRIGLIGANGSGKATLCRLLLGQQQPDDGAIHIVKGTSIGYLPQEPEFSGEESVWEVAVAAFAPLHKMELELRRLEEAMSAPGADDLDTLLDRHERLRHEYELAGGYEYETRVARVLTGVGFAEDQFPRAVRSLSGGEKSRAALAQLLLRQPDLLLLDEPTNHLDIQGIEWLEGYLVRYPGAVVVISHDRRFLDNVVGRIAELEAQSLTEYRGSYSAFVQQKEQRLETYERTFEQQQRERQRQLAFIRWALGTGQEKRIRAAKSRLKLLDKVDWLTPPPGQARKVNLHFTPRVRGGNEVLELRGLSAAYGSRQLFAGLGLFVRRGQRVGIVGPNGCGKSTLLRIILGLQAPQAGLVRLGSSVEVGYLEQERQASASERTVLEEFGEVVPGATPGELRHLLARFLFVEDDVYKQVGRLSGGEASRLDLAKLVMARPTCLVLDEPTNHLDIDSRGALEVALRDYQGTVIIVSHDRFFLDQVVDRLVAFEPDGVTTHEGNYGAYRQARDEEERQARAVREELEAEGKRERLRTERTPRKQRGRARPAAQPPSGPVLPSAEEAEGEVLAIEQQMEKIRALLSDPTTYAQGPRVRALNTEYARLSEQLRAAYALWEQVTSATAKHSGQA